MDVKDRMFGLPIQFKTYKLCFSFPHLFHKNYRFGISLKIPFTPRFFNRIFSLFEFTVYAKTGIVCAFRSSIHFFEMNLYLQLNAFAPASKTCWDGDLPAAC